ncbi:spore-associated protein A [Streptomyces sp. TRM68367]|uniref:spore-associated protein A n=1 Tax=Streptomyces sp. TRM68367 TaxID=2758415 RepID=UPI00165A7E9B|nr:spore-associated protein A [Streptomyces sp. TRM68367]MBC9725471.1 spore-associated protein A [Streptomyces sp. TRM68367]
MLTAASLALATPASAAGGIVPYNGACGSGYSVIDYKNISLFGGSDSATVYLTYNGRKNCAVTIQFRTDYKVDMKAAIRVSGGAWDIDSGDYYHYAGPVYTLTNSAGQCVDWYGGFHGIYDGEDNSHCG